MKNNDSRPAVFLDRDGTIIEDCGDLSDPAEVVFFDETFEALGRLAVRFPLFIVTNQSGVAKGTISMEDVRRVNTYIEERLAAGGVRIVATYVCPHQRSSACDCMKPSPFFLKEAERDYRIDLRNSFVVGDHPHDAEFAARVGATGFYLLSGHGIRHRDDIPAYAFVTEGIGAAAERILDIYSSR